MAQDHPGVGAPGYNYTLVVHRNGNPGSDAVDPSLSLTNPTLG